MSKKQLPVAPAGRPCARVTCETLPSALDRWDGGIKAAATDDISTENADDFEKNMISIRCEERLALAVKRPEAFVYGSFSTGAGS